MDIRYSSVNGNGNNRFRVQTWKKILIIIAIIAITLLLFNIPFTKDDSKGN